MKTSFCLAVFIAATFVPQAPVRAEPALKIGSCDQDAACAELAQRAHQFSKNNQLADALAAYQAAAQLSADPKLIFNIARILHKTGRFAQAVGQYQRYLQAGAEGSQVQRAKTEEYLAQAQRGVPVPSAAGSDARALPPAPSRTDSRAPQEGVQKAPSTGATLQPSTQPPVPLRSGQEAVARENLGPIVLKPEPLRNDCARPRRSRKFMLGGWTLIGIGGALIAAAIAPTVLSTTSGRCVHLDGSSGYLCNPPPPPPPNLWPVAGVGYGLGALSIGSGIGLLAGARRENRLEAAQGGTTCPN